MQAATVVWDGDTDGNFSTGSGANWVGNALPAPNDDLEFGTVAFTNAPTNNDITGLTVRHYEFGGLTDLTIGGNATTNGGQFRAFDGSSAASAVTFTVNHDVVRTSGGQYRAGGNVTIIMNGDISETTGAGAATVVNDVGTFIFNGDNSFTGGLTADNGTTVLGSDTAAGTAAISFEGDVGSATLALGDGVNIANAMTVKNNANIKTLSMASSATSAELSGDVTINETTAGEFLVEIASGQTLSLSGILSGAGGTLQKQGNGFLELSGANTFDGIINLNETGTTTDQGGVIARNATALGTGNVELRGGLLVVGDGVTLNGNNQTQVRNTGGFKGISVEETGSANAEYANDINIIDTQKRLRLRAGDGDTLTVSGDISSNTLGNGNQGFTKDGDGTVIVTGDNTYDGGTELAEGILQAGSANALGSGDLTFTGGTLRHSADNTVDYSSRIKNSTGLMKIDTNGQDVTWASVVDSSNTGGLFKDGLGTLTLTAANTYTGPSDGSDGVINGTVRVENNNALSADFNIGVLDFNDLTNRTMALEIGDGVNVSTNINMRNNSGSTPADNINKVLRVVDGETAELSGNVNVIETTDGVAQIEVGTGGQLTISGNIYQTQNNQNFTKTGDGTLILSGTDTTGVNSAKMEGANNRVAAGTLLLNGSFNNGDNLDTDPYGAFIVESGATLGGNGTWGGDVSTEAGSTLNGTFTTFGDVTVAGEHSPGNSPGLQDVGGNLSYTDGATVTWELQSNTADPTDRGTEFDAVDVGGDLSFAGTVNLTLDFNITGGTVDWSDSMWSNNQSWLFYEVAGTTSGLTSFNLLIENWVDGDGSFFNSDLTGASFYLSQQNQDIYLNYVVPEPSTALLLLGALGAMVVRRRR